MNASTTQPSTPATTTADRMAEALRNMPDDAGMIEHNPDEGMRLFCCEGKVIHSMTGSDRVEHASNCWYVAARATLVAYDAEKATTPASVQPLWTATEDTDSRGNRGQRIDSADVSLIAWVPYGNDAARGQSHARRILACVNAFAGIPTEAFAGLRLSGPVREVWCSTDSCGEHWGWEKVEEVPDWAPKDVSSVRTTFTAA